MSIFLNWKSTVDRSTQRMLLSLFSHISPRWYPNNIIRSTVYDIFEMYAGELNLLQVEVDAVFKDLNIEQVRTTSVGDQTSSKIYDNFGTMLGLSKLFYQDYIEYNEEYHLSSYRQGLRLLSQAYLEGTSIEAIRKIGWAFTGVAPLVIEPAKIYNGWKLTFYSGSVLDAGLGFIRISNPIPRYGIIIPTDVIGINVGDDYEISYTKLGHNTKLRGYNYTHSTLELEIFTHGSMSINSSFTGALEAALTRVLKADQNVRISYNDDFGYYRPVNSSNIDSVRSGSVPINDVLALSPQGYLYNYERTTGTGSVFIGDVISLPSIIVDAYSQSSDWYLDFFTITRNEAHIVEEVRRYSSLSIPDTVYFETLDRNEPAYLIPGTGSMAGVHYIPSIDGDSLADVSGNELSLSLLSEDNPHGMGRSRHFNRLAVTFGSGSTRYGISDSTGLNINNMFYCQMWISGVDNFGEGSISFTRGDGGGNSYGVLVDLDNEEMSVQIESGGGGLLSVDYSISDYLAEIPKRPHLFGFAYGNGLTHLYIDGELKHSDNHGVSILPDLNTGASLNLFINGNTGLELDEMILMPSFLTENEAEWTFRNTKPRLKYYGLPSGSIRDRYIQPKVTIYASGSNEAEFHQFSIRATKKRGLGLLTPNVGDIFYVPLEIFTPGTGS